ncbi:HNH endonuclease signature motif containing protein [soil metagenome]
MLDTVLDALAEATGCDRLALAGVVGEPPESGVLTAARLVERIGALERLANAAHAAQARDLAAFGSARLADDQREGVPEHLQGRSAAVEVGAAVRVATMTACGRLADASRAVRDHGELLVLVGTGAVSMAGLRKVIAATEVVEPAQRRQVAAELAHDACRSALTAGQLEKAALRRVLAADPRAAAKRAATARQRERRVQLSDPADGVAGVYATLRAEEALAAFGALDRTARGMRRDGDARSIDTLLADLFVERITVTPMMRSDRPTTSDTGAGSTTWRSVDGWEPWLWSTPPPSPPVGEDPDADDPAWDRWPTSANCGAPCTGHTGQPSPWRLPVAAEVQVVISASTLLGLDDEPGMLRGYGAIPSGVLHDILNSADSTGATARLRGLFCDPADGRLVAMDSTARCFTGGLRSFALWRDRDCRLSGGRIADIDHIDDHRHGGPTAAANGQGLGKGVHIVKDHPAITVRALPPTLEASDVLSRLRAQAPDIEWTMPTGHTHTRPPPPALGHGSRFVPANPSLGERHLRNLLTLAG